MAPVVDIDVDLRGIEGHAGHVRRDFGAFGGDDVDLVSEQVGADDLVTADVLDAAHFDRQPVAIGQGHEFRAHAQFHVTVQRAITLAQRDLRAVDRGLRARDRRGDQVHAGRADEIAHECMFGPLEQFLRRADLDHAAVVHHHHLVGKGQCLGLVVGHIDHRVPEFVVQRFQLGAQFPFHMGVDHRQRFVEQQCVHVLADHATAQRNLLLGIRRQATGAFVQHVLHADHLRDFLHPFGHVRRRLAAVAQWKGQVVVHGHRVVDDRKLEHLRDVAVGGAGLGHVFAVKQDAPLAGVQQARNDVQQRGFPTARGTQQGIGLAVGPVVVQLLQRKVGLGFRVWQVGMCQIVERDLCHVSSRQCIRGGRDQVARFGEDVDMRRVQIDRLRRPRFQVVHAVNQPDPCVAVVVQVNKGFDPVSSVTITRASNCSAPSLWRAISRWLGRKPAR